MKKLNGLTEIYKFFRTYKKPIYFVSASPFNILGLGQLVPTLRYVNYFDCFDGVHHRVFTPKDRVAPEFTCLEDVVNFLLEHQETNDFIKKQESKASTTFVPAIKTCYRSCQYQIEGSIKNVTEKFKN